MVVGLTIMKTAPALSTAKIDDHGLDRVVQVDRHAVAALDPAADQRVGQPVAVRAPTRRRSAPAAADQGGLVRAPRRALCSKEASRRCTVQLLPRLRGTLARRSMLTLASSMNRDQVVDRVEVLRARVRRPRRVISYVLFEEGHQLQHAGRVDDAHVQERVVVGERRSPAPKRKFSCDELP